MDLLFKTLAFVFQILGCLGILRLTAALCLLLGLFTVLPIGISFSFGPLAAAAGYVLAAAYGYRQLDGMSGDISGFALTLGELAGVTVWALGR